MDLVLKSRGVRITQHVRRAAERKLARIERFGPSVRRLEVEIIGERNPRIDGSHRVEVAAVAVRHVFRAHGAGNDVDSALDRVVERLERQISDHRGKLLDRRHGKGTRGVPGRPPMG